MMQVKGMRATLPTPMCLALPVTLYCSPFLPPTPHLSPAQNNLWKRSRKPKSDWRARADRSRGIVLPLLPAALPQYLSLYPTHDFQLCAAIFCAGGWRVVE